MKKDLALAIISMLCLAAGFALFLFGAKEIAVVSSLVGIFIYLYMNKKKKEESA